MTHGRLFTGIGGFDLGFERAGMESLWQVEREPYALKVLERHWPNVERYTDVKDVGKHNLKPVDILSGGFPCQDVSVAGKRGGLQASRSGLFYEVVRILGEMRPQWFILENVPGLLSSDKGKDFRIVIETLTQLRYGICWRVLDSLYFGVAQRRRRVFIVGHLGSLCPPEILFERPRSTRDSKTGQRKEAHSTGVITKSIETVGRGRDNGNGNGNRTGNTVLLGRGTENGHSRYIYGPDDAGEEKVSNSPGIAIRTGQTGSNGWGVLQDGTVHTLDRSTPPAVLIEEAQDQRHTPTNTPPDPDRMRSPARLPEGLDDPGAMEEKDLLPKGIDSPRYKATGNAVTVNVAEWIGKRIVAVSEELTISLS